MKRFWVGFINGLCCLFICIALALAALLSCDWLYRADVRLLDVPQRSGLSEPVIVENYHAVTAYLAPWNEDAFALRGLTWSADGAEYFRQLRVCVLAVYTLGLLGGIGLICLHGARRRLGRKVWNVSGALSLGLVTLCGVLLALDFGGALDGFCSLLFGEHWRLYEDLDPIVTLFHPSFFLHAAFFVLFVCVAGCVMQFAAGYTPAVPAARREKAAAEPKKTAAPVVEKQVFRLRDQQDNRR